MFRSEREIEILSILEDNQYVTVEYLAKKMHISQSSIRRDLTNLENRGIVKRNYGGVELANASNKVIPFSMRSHENANEKKKIAKVAASLVKNGDIVFIDGSSSTFFMVDYLAKIKDITVITNSIDATYILSQYNVKTICTGGIVSYENNSVLIEDFAKKVIKNCDQKIILGISFANLCLKIPISTYYFVTAVNSIKPLYIYKATSKMLTV